METPASGAVTGLVNKQADTSVEGVAPSSTPAEAEKREGLLSPQLAALARKERAMRQQVAAEKKLISEEKTRLEALRAEIDQAKSWKSKLSSDPWSALIEAGLTPDQVTQAMLNQPKPEDMKFMSLEEQIKELKSNQERAIEEAKKAQDQQYEEAKNQILKDVTRLVANDESFETIKATKMEGAVVDYIDQVFKEEGTLLSIEDASKDLEEALFEQVMGLTELKKLKAKLNPPAPVETPEAKAPAKPSYSTQPTLSNRIQQAPSTNPNSEKARKERAMAAFLGQKTS